MQNLTERMARVIKVAEKELKITNSSVITTGHLLLGCLLEKTGTLGEIYLKGAFDIDEIRKNVKYSSDYRGSLSSHMFTVPISTEVDMTLKTSFSYMNRYNQTYLSVDHLLKALLHSGSVDHLLTAKQRQLILSLGTTARDMITHLANYTFPKLHSNKVREVNYADFDKLVPFVENHFSSEWAETIQKGFLKETPTMYLALNDEQIIGFAAYDVYQNKKCYFGPMGVSKNNRIKGIGRDLLHHCLRDMKKIGYEYAIIGGAGPIEFYEKACNAVVIPTTLKNK